MISNISYTLYVQYVYRVYDIYDRVYEYMNVIDLMIQLELFVPVISGN